MKEVIIFCTNCGAKLNALSNDLEVCCDYCGCVNENIKFEPEKEFNEEKSESNFFSSLGHGLKKAGKFLNSLANEFEEDENHHHHHGKTINENAFEVGHGKPYYAIIKKSSLFYEGECPGVTFCKVSLCDSYDECVNKLVEKLSDEVNRFGGKSYDQPSLEEIKNSYPNAKIIKIYPKI